MAHNYEAIGRAAVSGLYLKISIPKGYEAVDFRQPGKGETILGAMAGDYTYTLVTDGANFDERLILRKVEPKIVGFTVRSLDRIPQFGETYIYAEALQRPVKDDPHIYERLCIGADDINYRHAVAVSITPIYEDQE